MGCQDRHPRVDHYTLGMELYRQGQYEQALDELGHLQDRPDLIGRVAGFYRGMSHRALGMRQMQEGRFDQAATHLREAAGTIGRQAKLCSYLAALYAGTGRYDACADELEKAVAADADNGQAIRCLAQAQYRSGRREQAYLTLLSALRRLPASGPLHLQMGLFLAGEERFEQAHEHLAQAAQHDCTNPRTHFYLALNYAARGEGHQALRSFQRAFDLRSDDLRIAMHLALAARAVQERGEHVVIRIRETAQPSTPSQIRQLARYVTAEGDFLDAFLALPPSPADAELFGMLAGVLQMALSEHPAYADLHLRLSQVAARLDRVEAAREHGQRALAINPAYVQAMVHLARLEARAGRRDQAARYADLAIRRGADWPDVHCLAGEMLAERDQPLARRHFERALQLNHNYTRAADALSHLAA